MRGAVGRRVPCAVAADDGQARIELGEKFNGCVELCARAHDRTAPADEALRAWPFAQPHARRPPMQLSSSFARASVGFASDHLRATGLPPCMQPTASERRVDADVECHVDGVSDAERTARVSMPQHRPAAVAAARLSLGAVRHGRSRELAAARRGSWHHACARSGERLRGLERRATGVSAPHGALAVSCGARNCRERRQTLVQRTGFPASTPLWLPTTAAGYARLPGTIRILACEILCRIRGVLAGDVGISRSRPPVHRPI